jgi:hypothetical protein
MGAPVIATDFLWFVTHTRFWGAQSLRLGWCLASGDRRVYPPADRDISVPNAVSFGRRAEDDAGWLGGTLAGHEGLNAEGGAFGGAS